MKYQYHITTGEKQFTIITEVLSTKIQTFFGKEKSRFLEIDYRFGKKT